MADVEESGGGRKKTLDLNLVPFIDLMSVLITFLLITAVWSQVSMIKLGTSVAGKKTEAQKQEKTPDSDVVLKLEVKSAGYTLIVAKNTVTIPKTAEGFDDNTLLADLQKAKEQYPNKVDGFIAMEDDQQYEQMIKSMDLFLKAGFINVSFLTGNP